MDGAEILLLSILGPVLVCEWSLEDWEVALLSSVSFLGYAFGAIFFGKIGDIHGRRSSLLFGACIIAYYGIISSAVPNIIWLMILRCILGIGIGALPQASIIYVELLPVHYRGKAVMLIEVFFAFGGVFAASMALVLLNNIGWRLWLLSCSAPALIFLVFLKWLPESPRYYIASGQHQKALGVLQRAAALNNVSLPSAKIREQKLIQRGNIKDLFQKKYRITTILVVLACSFGALNYMGMVLAATYLIKFGTTCPSNVELQRFDSSTSDCSCVNPLTNLDIVNVLLTAFAEVPGLLVAMFLIDIIGRKNTMILATVIYLFSCISLNICVGGTMLSVILFVARAAVTANLQILVIYIPEIYPTAFRAIALGIGFSSAKVASIITPYFAQVLLVKSVHSALFIYASTAFAILVCTCLLPADKTGQQMEEVEEVAN